MTSGITSTATSERMDAVTRRHGKKGGRRLLAVAFVMAGSIASVAAGVGLAYSRRQVECVLLDSPARLRAGSHATVRLRLSNETGRTVKLRPRRLMCVARLEGVPTELQPHESRQAHLVLNTAGLNGAQHFAAAISTDITPRLVAVAADVQIDADWVIRRVALGALPTSAAVARRIRVSNVPAANLVRIGRPTPPYWSARLASVGHRSVEIDLAATLPALDAGLTERREVCELSLFFANADVRRVQVLATAIATRDADRIVSRQLVAEDKTELASTGQQ